MEEGCTRRQGPRGTLVLDKEEEEEEEEEEGKGERGGGEEQEG